MKTIGRKIFTRALTLLLAASMLLTFLVSCKGSQSDPGDSTTTTTSKPKKDFNDFLYSGETVKLYGADLSPVIYVDRADYKQSVRAVGDLVDDFERVTGKKPKVVYNEADLAGAGLAIIIGTLGKSSLVTYLEEEGYIGLDAIKGQWEAYNISVVENPTENIGKAIVIAGSDKRGTIYGTYEISELIGVSPWYFWGDVEIEHKDEITLPVEKLTKTDMPDVKYRGIFINDEENMTAWSTKFVSKNSLGKPNPGMYKHVFELLLRLRANTLWPAMHAQSDAFNEYKNPDTGISFNAELADEYGIVMSASHCEMLLRNNEGEWTDWCVANQGKYNLKKINDSWHSSYDYTVNAEAMNAYWEERVAENYLFENIYMIGLRGVHDSGINCSALSDKSYKGKATVVKKAVEAQLEILAKYEKKYEEVTGEAIKFETCYCVYKEAAEYFKYDIGLPKDCCLMYAEDNHGYIRSTVSDKDKENYSKFGMYYHVSYWGRPTSYLWISNTPLVTIAEEMRKSYYTGTDDIWILNVGDIKPAEFKTEYFMELGWDVDSHTEHNTEEFTVQFLQQNFGFDTDTSKMFAATLTDFYQHMRSYYPEIIDKHTDTGSYPYSVVNYGAEGFRIIEELTEAYNQSLALYNSLPDGKKESFYELFHYTIYSYLLSIEKHVYKEMNHLCYDQGRYAAANLYADLSEAAYYAILAEIEYYNKTLAGGKWDKIMNPYNSTMPLIEGAPDVKRASSAQASGGVGLSAETQTDITRAATLLFGSLNNDIRYIDIFNKGTESAAWTLSAPSYIVITDSEGNVLTGSASGNNVIYSGTVEVESRYYLTVNWEVFSKGETKQGTIILQDNLGGSGTVNIKATKNSADPATESNKGYYEENGLVSIEAEHYTENVAVGGFKWIYVDGLGRSGGVMMAVAENENNGYVNVSNRNNIASECPYIDYKINFTNTGTYYGTFYRLPTLNESASGKTYCSTGWSFDGSAVKHLNGTTTADDADNSRWGNMIKLHIEELAFKITVETAGWHTLRIYMINSLMAFDKIVLNQNADVASRLDAPETFNTVSEWVNPGSSSLPELSLDDADWGKFSALYDFTTSTVQSGYTAITASKGSLENNGWEWASTEGIKGYYRSASKMHPIDLGFVSGEGDSTLKVKLPYAGEYSFTVSVGDPQGTIVAKDMTVSANGKVLLSGINGKGKNVERYYFRAATDENGVIELTVGGTWILGSLEIYSAPKAESTAGGAFIANEDGNIIIEAEAALENSDYAYTVESSDGAGYKWAQVGGEFGDAMYFGPNAGSSYTNASINASNSAKLFYTMNLEKAGTYSVWVYVKCSGDNDDSLFLSIADKVSTTLNDIATTDGYEWVRVGSYEITKTGEVRLVILGREDGLAIDRILVHPESVPSMDYNGDSCRAESDAE